ncbi:glutamate--tRNA ligase [Rubinisphaera italica]|uniref:Glutamate--tRNA ligase n=1 Tax=Rubinisphaera italica TaxID=2527969 RepID=A0A5C5XHE9_9PLAN|nr:glutamate--tRNA ligase [Rubinisphaera italica]TWT62517.1 Glutamate--tRNA ligase 1 [Rubinisphaera italica]
MKAIRTRFAPSPTGYMHIGGMRTALFNWVFAKHHQGTFILRIDDTDQARNVESALEPILQAFRWLGIPWDEGPETGGDFGPYFQSERTDFYQKHCQTLIEKRLAFYDFTTPDQSRAEREAAEKEKRNYINNRNDFDLDSATIQERIDRGDNYVIRFLVPRDTDKKIVIDDAVRGHVEFDPSTMPDPVIMRSNGLPLYNFASVIDDASMQISHVIRAEEHLSNTPVQALLFDALEFERPTFAHIPYVAAPGTKEKLSKRKLEQYRKNPKFKKLFQHGDFIFPLLGLENNGGLDPVMVEYYEKIGYLPDAVFNALARIGWSLDDQTEVMSRETIIENFTLERIVKSPAGFDPDKLLSFQAEWMGKVPLSEKALNCIPYLATAGYVHAGEKEYSHDYIEKVVAAVGERLVVWSDILRFDEFFVTDDELKYEEKAFKKRVVKPEDACTLLAELAEELTTSNCQTSEDFDQFVHQFVENKEIGIGQIIHALRVAVTGKAAGVGMFDAMELLGTDRCVKRIRRTLKLKTSSDSQ